MLESLRSNNQQDRNTASSIRRQTAWIQMELTATSKHTPWPQLIDRFLPAPPKKSITLPTFSIIHTTGSGEEIWKHISLGHSGHLWAHRLCSITTGLRAANMDYTSRKNNSWKPPDMYLMASPAYENPKCTDISAKCDSKPQETAHSPSEARVAAARPQIHRKNPAYTLSCSLALLIFRII